MIVEHTLAREMAALALEWESLLMNGLAQGGGHFWGLQGAIQVSEGVLKVEGDSKLKCYVSYVVLCGCAQAAGAPVLLEQLTPIKYIVKASLRLARMQAHSGQLAGFLGSSRAKARTEATSVVMSAVDKIREWSLGEAQGLSSENQEALSTWVSAALKPRQELLEEKVQKMQTVAEELVKTRLSSAIDALKPWARGAPNTRSWKAGLASDCSWPELLTASSMLVDKNTATAVTQHFDKLVEES